MITLVLMSLGTAYAAQTQMVLDPQKGTVTSPGAEIDLEVQVKDVSALYGIKVNLEFDPAVLEVVKLKSGDIFPNSQFIPDNINNETGVIKFSRTFMGEVQGFSGNGTIARITFKAKKEGSSQIKFVGEEAKAESTMLVNEDIEPIEAILRGSIVTAGNAKEDDLPDDSQSGDVSGNDNSSGNNNGNDNSNNNSSNSNNKNNQPAVPNQGNSPITYTTVNNPANSLKDMKGHWAEQAVNKLISKGIVKGYEDGSYKPEAKVTRAEFIKLVVLAGGLENKQGNQAAAAFNDSANIPAWAASFFQVAARNGLIKGDEGNMILPGKQITRAELAAIVVRAAGWEQEATSFNEKLSFKDREKIPAWAQGYIGVAVKHGLISGFPDNNFKYDSQATRAEAAVMAERLIGVL